MKLFVLLLHFSLTSSLRTLTPGDFNDAQLRDYESQYHILQKLLAKECAEDQTNKREELSVPDARLKLRKIQVEELQWKIVECIKKKKAVTKPTLSTTAATTSFPPCPLDEGDTELYLQLISYDNPTNERASGTPCNEDGSPCNIFFEICVSALNSSNCEFKRTVTDIVEGISNIFLIGNLGDKLNPLRVRLGDKDWQGVHFGIKVLDKTGLSGLQYSQMVDEFSYQYLDMPGTYRVVNLKGMRGDDKTVLTVQIVVLCPSPSTTAVSATLKSPTSFLPTTTTMPTTTTPTTTTPITTASTTTPTSAPLLSTYPTQSTPQECLNAANLSEFWRLDYDGMDIRGGKSHTFSPGWACDLHQDLEWFRFTGAAGTRMLNTCPKYKSCGTAYPLWTNATHPQAIGTSTNISVYAVDQGGCARWSYPVQVTRCGANTDHDFVYKYVGQYISPCSYAFCGMN